MNCNNYPYPTIVTSEKEKKKTFPMRCSHSESPVTVLPLKNTCDVYIED